MSAGSTKMARHLLPATKERIGFGEGVQQARDMGVPRNWESKLAIMPQIVHAFVQNSSKTIDVQPSVLLRSNRFGKV